MENAISNAERRALACGESVVVPRVADIYSAMPSITGKFELEYEGELRGAERVAHELIRGAIARVYDEDGQRGLGRQIVQWFDMGGSLKLRADAPGREVVKQMKKIQGLSEAAADLAQDGRTEPEILASAGELILDGLYAHRRLSRSEEVGYSAQERKAPKKQKRRQDFAPSDFGESFN
jgi:magnesium chelatase subunit I